MEPIRVDVGVCTLISIDLTEFDFTGIEKLIFSIKNSPLVSEPTIVERILSTEKGVQIITITPEESVTLKKGAQYDIDKVTTDGNRYKITDNGDVILRYGVGDCIE